MEVNAACSLWTQEWEALESGIPVNGRVSPLNPAQLPYTDASRNKLPDGMVPRRSTQLTLVKSAGQTQLFVDGVLATPDEDGVVRLDHFHAGEPHMVRSVDGEGKVSRYKAATGVKAGTHDASVVAPLLVSSVVEDGEVEADSITLSVYQIATVDGEQQPEELLAERPVSTSSVADAEAGA